MEHYVDLISAAEAKDAVSFQAALHNAIANKVAVVLDGLRAEVATDIFNPPETNEAVGHIEKGAFHAWLGKSEDEPITAADIAKGKAAGGHAAKMATFAQNFGGHNLK